MTRPGPYARSNPLRHAGGAHRERASLRADLAAIVDAELAALAPEGAELIQIDEPNFVMPRDGDAQEPVELFDRTIEAIPTKIALHVCLGNLNNKLFAAPRVYGRFFRRSSTAVSTASSSSSPIGRWRRSS